MAGGNGIPTRVRDAVRVRDGGHCLRCGAGGGLEIHHRQPRRTGGHGLANCLSLCRVCHAWAHGNPAAARADGFIVSIHTADVAAIVLASWLGPVTLDAAGGVSSANPQVTSPLLANVGGPRHDDHESDLGAGTDKGAGT